MMKMHFYCITISLKSINSNFMKLITNILSHNCFDPYFRKVVFNKNSESFINST